MPRYSQLTGGVVWHSLARLTQQRNIPDHITFPRTRNLFHQYLPSQHALLTYLPRVFPLTLQQRRPTNASRRCKTGLPVNEYGRRRDADGSTRAESTVRELSELEENARVDATQLQEDAEVNFDASLPTTHPNLLRRLQKWREEQRYVTAVGF